MTAKPVYPRVGKSLSRPPVSDCEIFPWLGDEVQEALEDAWANGIRDPRGLLLMTLTGVYPVTPEGHRLVWPSVPGDCPSIKALETRVGYRVRMFVGVQEDQEAQAAWEGAGGR